MKMGNTWACFFNEGQSREGPPLGNHREGEDPFSLLPSSSLEPLSSPRQASPLPFMASLLKPLLPSTPLSLLFKLFHLHFHFPRLSLLAISGCLRAVFGCLRGVHWGGSGRGVFGGCPGGLRGSPGVSRGKGGPGWGGHWRVRPMGANISRSSLSCPDFISYFSLSCPERRVCASANHLC